jgi:hypothetical protein
VTDGAGRSGGRSRGPLWPLDGPRKPGGSPTLASSSLKAACFARGPGCLRSDGAEVDLADPIQGASGGPGYMVGLEAR